MSRAREAATARGNTIVLPNIPRMTDDKSRMKYMTDYEKYEPELRKHHLGGADTTNTVSLKDVPADFDRAMPNLNEPTAAEKEYERVLQLRNSQRKKRRFRPASTIARQTKKEHLPTEVAPCATSAAVTPEDGSVEGIAADSRTSAAGSRTPAADSKTPAADSRTPAADSRTSAAGSRTPAADSRTPAADSRTSAAGSRTSMADSKTPAADSRTSAAGSRTSVADSKTPAADSRTPAAAMMLSTSRPSTTIPTVGRNAPATARTPSAPLTSRQPLPQLPGPCQYAGPTKPPPATPQKRSPRLSPSRLRSTAPQSPVAPPAADPEELLRVLQATTRPMHISKSEVGPTLDAGACADILRVLVAPPPEYSDSFQINMDQFDLAWLYDGRLQPVRLNSIQTVHLGVGRPPKINSPRSVLAFLRNGVTVADLQPKKIVDTTDSATMLNPKVRDVVHRFRTEREAARRDCLRALILESYLTLCEKVPLGDLIHAFQHPPERSSVQVVPSSLARRRERQARIFQANKNRQIKQMELMKEVYERRLIAADRQEKSEAEMVESIARKATEDVQLRAAQQARLVEQRRHDAEKEEAYRQLMTERMQKVEERNKERLEARDRLFQSRQQQRAAIAEERQHRFQRQEESRRQFAAQKEKLRLEKLAKIESLMEERRVRERQERREIAERQSNAADARKEALRRAELKEREMHAAALERQKQVDQRLEAFHKQRLETQAHRAAMESEKEEQRHQAYELAAQSQEELRVRILEHRQAHEAAFDKLQRQQEMKRTVQLEQDREQAALKAYTVLQQQRQVEYCKLKTISELVERRKAADFVIQQREVILEEALKSREALQAEREALKKELGPTGRV